MIGEKIALLNQLSDFLSPSFWSSSLRPKVKVGNLVRLDSASRSRGPDRIGEAEAWPGTSRPSSEKRCEGDAASRTE